MPQGLKRPFSTCAWCGQRFTVRAFIEHSKFECSVDPEALGLVRLLDFCGAWRMPDDPPNLASRDQLLAALWPTPA